MVQNVYMANASGQGIYVMASLNHDWAIADFVMDIGELLVGIEELKLAVGAAEFPETIKTFRDLYNALKEAIKFVPGTVHAVKPFLDAFKKTAVLIASGDYKDVYENGFLSTYLSADGIASLLGASNVSMMVLSEDGKQLAMWNTGSGDSWIATNKQKIVQSKHGSIWQQDPDAGTQDWPISISSA